MTDIEIQNCIKRMEIRIAELGWSKEEFYEKSGVSSASYSQWNTGVHKPTKKKLAKAAAVLGISLEYLMTGEGQKNKPDSENAVGPIQQLLLEKIPSISDDQANIILDILNGMQRRDSEQ